MAATVDAATRTLSSAYHTPLPGLVPANSPQSAKPTVGSNY